MDDGNDVEKTVVVEVRERDALRVVGHGADLGAGPAEHDRRMPFARDESKEEHGGHRREQRPGSTPYVVHKPHPVHRILPPFAGMFIRPGG
jgi:hypothetical protein